MTAPILEVKNLRKQFEDFQLKDIDIALECGYIMGFIGPNGAGKSTTIKLILNLLKKNKGEIKIFGMDHIKDEQEVKNRIGFVLDENFFYEELTVAEMKRVIAPLYTAWDHDAFNRYIRDFNVPSAKKIKDLSKGMKMKFSLAVALSHHADLLIMDEPTSGLDPVIRSELLQILSEFIQDDHKGVLFSTHITSDLDKIADYVTMIHDGEIVFSLEKDVLLDNYGLVKGPKGVLEEDMKKHFIGIRENQFGFEGLVTDRKKTKKALGEKVMIEKPTLEDIMLYYTRRDKNV
ncbi:ABC transporter ATP-binding protein [Petroclostridium sp. X23]|uniref:ABC transporter ATP-binding protein n=1 Tax=Petroclostridium sp. X23 TaxID=3045146 RepID=UPI0024ADACD7|nr:ABC transporter ATP-binding protein [Petroclostridium sp. X23]WHH58208.1 ABC transporter ATP-binding protein [Petroclostridium sp. X23]